MRFHTKSGFDLRPFLAVYGPGHFEVGDTDTNRGKLDNQLAKPAAKETSMPILWAVDEVDESKGDYPRRAAPLTTVAEVIKNE